MKGSRLLAITILGLCSRVQLVCIRPPNPTVTASCTTSAKDLTGCSAVVLCPALCLNTGGSIWGTDLYTADSSICRAAIHAGLISNNGGQVTVQKKPGQASYSGSTRNGITSNSYGAWSGSFIFPNSASQVTASCSTAARDITGSSASIFCPTGCLTNGGSIWGTNVYTDDSSICRAAIHAGIISNNGGLVTMQKTPGQASYSGSTSNGITSNSYGSWSGSFIFNSASPVTPEPTGDITPIPSVTATCTTAAKDIAGSTADVFCPPQCLTNGGTIWGTDVYTDDSSICRAAIHAGLISNSGGQVTVQKIPGQASYSGSTRNGITTYSYGAWTGSFIFNSASPVTPEPTNPITPRPSVTASCTTAARDLTGSSADVFCPPQCLTNGGTIWGTDVYTDDSSICRAAIHAGLISNYGGQVTVQKIPGQSSYSGSTRNGITSNSYGSWSGSFIFNSGSPVTPEPTNPVTQRPPVAASCTTRAEDITGSSADVFCPPQCLTNGGTIWGTDIYTDDSSICRAAIHAGLISNYGGQITVQKIPGQSSYIGSTRNGITSNSYGAWSGSFIFNTASPVTPEPTTAITPRPSVTASCTTAARDITGSSADIFCPAQCLINGGTIWGTSVYTDDSSICRAAIHAGLISNNGGQITMQKTPGQASYSGSTRNGITSYSYGAWTGSFTFVPQQPAVQASCSTAARNLQQSPSVVQCPPGCLANGISVWGTDVYTDDSSICRAAIHAGVLTNNGGQIRVSKIPGQTTYTGSTRNGVTTSSYGQWSGSFVIYKV